jgi:membrane-associated protease RseP (regulator of RpoE activity)
MAPIRPAPRTTISRRKASLFSEILLVACNRTDFSQAVEPMKQPFQKTAFLTAAGAVVLTSAWQLHAADLHVSPAGNDSHPGTSAAPFRTLAAARDAARMFTGKETVTVHVGDGIYYLPETLVFTAADSGSEEHPVTYRAATEGNAVISGGRKLKLDWKPWRDGIMMAGTPDGMSIDQLFIDGRRQHMARYPDFDPDKPTAAYQGFAADAISKERAARWADPAGGYIHAMHVHRWGGYHYRITGKNPDGSLAYEGGWQNNRQMGMHNQFRMVENIFEELDAPGEWFHNSGNNTLYFMPGPGIELANAAVEVVELPHLVEFQGTREKPVRFIRMQGFVFRHTARTFMDNREPLLRSDWTIYRGGAVLLTGTEDIHILDSEFDQPGGNAVFVNHYNRRALVKGCHIHDAGASGVCFVGDPEAVRNPLFEYAQTHDLTQIDRTPGPKTDNHPADSSVEDCLIHGIGRVERQPAGVQISMARRITVRDTSIYDCARAGINISEGTWGGHLIERCDVFDTVLETHDHGSFNSWGRDRYWINNHRGVSEPEVSKDPKLPFLDAMETTIIRDSRWRCDHGWDIDLDDGSSNYDIFNNLMLAGGLKLREGYHRKAYNNIHINNALHPHVWFDQSGDQFTRNIVMTAHKPIGQPEGWGRAVDKNLFAFEADLRKSQAAGADLHSISGDPMFIDPTAGDFRVNEGSPAFKIGFMNFPMDQFGVKKPSLKAIARTPVIPELRVVDGAGSAGGGLRLYWLGAPLHSLQGQEFSAFGVSREAGGVQLVKVPAGSPAARAGLQDNDLVQGVNGQQVSNTDQLFAALIKAGSTPLELRIIRNQLPKEMKLTAVPFIGTETATGPEGFFKLPPKPTPDILLTANHPVSNNPLSDLTDGRLAAGYGGVFANGIGNGAFKMDLGSTRPVRAFSSWSFNQNGKRGRQIVTIYGSDSVNDPGWNVNDTGRFTPLGSIDTASLAGAAFTAASLRAPANQNLGSFRWVVWQTTPVSGIQENTAWQELAVEISKQPD